MVAASSTGGQTFRTSTAGAQIIQTTSGQTFQLPEGYQMVNTNGKIIQSGNNNSTHFVTLQVCA